MFSLHRERKYLCLDALSRPVSPPVLPVCIVPSVQASLYLHLLLYVHHILPVLEDLVPPLCPRKPSLANSPKWDWLPLFSRQTPMVCASVWL